jgi:uncharacterized iron-regulated membrane protein
MARPTISKLRRFWLQVHKWIGLLLAVLIIPVSVTGSALVWHDGLEAMLNPERSVSAPASLPPAAYVEAARRELAPGERIHSLTLPEEEGAVLVSAARPPREGERRPVRSNLWLDPQSGALVDKAGSDEGAVRVLHVLHGSLMVPGIGRQIVGWIGVFMLISCLTGLWLWWPVTGSVRRGFRWRRQPSFNANLHHQLGFWVMVPLAMLSFTGVWISFPQAFGRFEASAPKAPAPPQRPAQPLDQPRLSLDDALAAARSAAPDGSPRTVSWPTDQRPEWTIAFARGSGPDVKVAEADGTATPVPPPPPETTARLMRRLHDGTGMGLGWQIVIFLGGLIPAALAVTGILMWWRSRQWRRHQTRRQQPAAAQ